MTTSIARRLLVLLAALGLYVGVYACFAPAEFHTDFPLGRGWVQVDGYFDEHLVRDVGSLYLALVAVTVVALVRPRAQAVRTAGLAWTVFGVPHVVYHLSHLPTSLPDAVGNVVSLGGTALLGLVLLLPWRRTATSREIRQPAVER